MAGLNLLRNLFPWLTIRFRILHLGCQRSQ